MPTKGYNATTCTLIVDNQSAVLTDLAGVSGNVLLVPRDPRRTLGGSVCNAGLDLAQGDRQFGAELVDWNDSFFVFFGAPLRIMERRFGLIETSGEVKRWRPEL